MKSTTTHGVDRERAVALTVIEGAKRNAGREMRNRGPNVTLRLVAGAEHARISSGSEQPEPGSCLDSVGDRNPLLGHNDGDERDDLARSDHKTKVRPEYLAFAKNALRELPKVGLLFLITISPPNGVSLTAILRAFCAALDAWDCDYYSALDRGKRNNKEHVHSIVFTRDPTSFIRRFGAWMEKHAINAAATDVQPVKGCSNYVIGRGDEQLTKDLMFMAGYPTKGGPARPPAQSRARGVFVRARRQLLRDTEHTVMTAANTGACDECGGPLPSGATQRRRFCRDACKLKSFRRRRHERTFWRITLRRKLPRR